MARLKVNHPDGQVFHFDGEKRTAYKVAAGEIVVDDAHVAAVQASFPDSEIMPEAPAKKEK